MRRPVVAVVSRFRPARPAVAMAGALVLVGVLGVGGCAEKRWIAPQSVSQQTEQQIRRARDLAIKAQRAELDGRTAEAISLYRQAVGEYREFAAAWNNLGRLLMQQGDGLEAAQALRTAADLDLTDPTPLYNLGVLWEDRGYAEDAAKYYSQALTRDENHKPSLRRSIYIDQHVRMRGDDITARRLRRALLIEDDPTWREFFERERIRLEASETNGGEGNVGLARERS